MDLFTGLVTGCEQFCKGNVSSGNPGMNGTVKRNLVTGLVPSRNQHGGNMVKKIVSGGQTGADRAGVDVAIECGVEYGRWLPKGRMAEDGTASVWYKAMQEKL
jgi:hypothetical protein